jgi:hypothetical protein
VSIRAIDTPPAVVLSSDDFRAIGESCDGYELFSTAASLPPLAAFAAQRVEGQRIEAALRELLLDLRIIPMTVRTPERPDIVSVLRQQVDLSRRDYKLRLSLKLTAVERALSEGRDEFSRQWKLGDLLDLLQSGFDSRQGRRMEALRLFCRPVTSKVASSFERALFARGCQVQAAVLGGWIRHFDNHSLDRIFTTVQQWSSQPGSFDLEFAGLHDFLMRSMTFVSFRTLNQVWVVTDSYEVKRLKRRKAEEEWR